MIKLRSIYLILLVNFLSHLNAAEAEPKRLSEKSKSYFKSLFSSDKFKKETIKLKIDRIVSEHLEKPEFEEAYHGLCQMAANPLMIEATKIEQGILSETAQKLESLIEEINEAHGLALRMPTSDDDIPAQIVEEYIKKMMATTEVDITSLLFKMRELDQQSFISDNFIIKEIIPEEGKSFELIYLSNKFSALQKQVEKNKEIADAIFSIPAIVKTFFKLKLVNQFIIDTDTKYPYGSIFTVEWDFFRTETLVYVSVAGSSKEEKIVTISFPKLSGFFRKKDEKQMNVMKFFLKYIGEKEDLVNLEKYYKQYEDIKTTENYKSHIEDTTNRAITAEQLEEGVSSLEEDLSVQQFTRETFDKLGQVSVTAILKEQLQQIYFSNFEKVHYNFFSCVKLFDEKIIKFLAEDRQIPHTQEERQRQGTQKKRLLDIQRWEAED